MSEVIYEGTYYTIYRFVSSINDMHVKGTVVTDQEEIDFWRKRYIWMEWMTAMDNWQLELMSIGWAHPARPFNTAHYNDTYIDGLRDYMRKLHTRRAPRQDRTILVEEVYATEEDAINAGA